MMNDNQPSTENTKGNSVTLQVPNLENITQKRTLIPGSFALIILCFFLSFCDFTCSGQKIASLSGYDLALGTQISMPSSMFSKETKSEKMPANGWAILAIVAAVCGLVVFLVKLKKENLIGLIAGAAGLVSLLILYFSLKSEVKKQGQGVIDVSFQFGFALAVILFAFAAGLCYLRFKNNKVLVENEPLPVD